MLLMPSRYEPCGIAQMIAMLYGCIPIAHATGGLKDTITDPYDNSEAYTGFLFNDALADACAGRRSSRGKQSSGRRPYGIARDHAFLRSTSKASAGSESVR